MKFHVGFIGRKLGPGAQVHGIVSGNHLLDGHGGRLRVDRDARGIDLHCPFQRREPELSVHRLAAGRLESAVALDALHTLGFLVAHAGDRGCVVIRKVLEILQARPEYSLVRAHPEICFSILKNLEDDVIIQSNLRRIDGKLSILQAIQSASICANP